MIYICNTHTFCVYGALEFHVSHVNCYKSKFSHLMENGDIARLYVGKSVGNYFHKQTER